MADVALLAPAVTTAPEGYQVPGAQEIIVKAITASYDGTGAGGSFVPTLQIVAPNGTVVANCPLGSTLAAGASADISWFPDGGLSVGQSASVGTWQYATPVAPASAQPGWVAGAAFQNSWINLQLADGSYSPLRYRTVPEGVQMIGAIGGGSLGTTVLTMPTAFVPPFDAVGLVGSAYGTTAFTTAVSASTGSLSVVGGSGAAEIVARGNFTSIITTTGTTFATGTDLLASALTFISDGASDYLVEMFTLDYIQSAAGSVLVHLNLDGVDGGNTTAVSMSAAGFAQAGWASSFIPSLAAGAHTVNLRIVVGGGTGTVNASTTRPGLITVSRLPL
jgi:hypothetical protein